MEGSSYQTLKQSLVFLWNNKRIALASIAFSIVGALIAFALLFLILFIAGALGVGFNALGFDLSTLTTVPRTLAWSQGIAASSIGLLMLTFFSTLALGFFYPRVAESLYILSALRRTPVSFGKALSTGMHLVVRGWKIPLVGFIVIPACMLGLLTAIFYVSDRLPGIWALLLVLLVIITWVLIYLAQFYAAQLVVDGQTSFTTMLTTSWHYFKRSYLRLLAIWIMLLILGIPITAISFALGTSGASISSVISAVWGYFTAIVTAVAVNKVYLQVRAR